MTESVQQHPAAPYAPVEDPGKTIGIVGFVFAFVFAPVGLILSAIARSKSKKAGFKNSLASWGLGLSIVFTILWIAYVIFVVWLGMQAMESGQVPGY